MIQDILPFKFNNHYEKLQPDNYSYLFAIKNNKLFAKIGESDISFPKVSHVYEMEEHNIEPTYLFSVDDNKFFYLCLTENDELKKLETMLEKKGYGACDISFFRRNSLPKWLRFAAVTAMGLNRWYSQNKYCGCCGGIMKHSEGERMLYCPKCNVMQYPKICPAVIVGIVYGNRILVTKYKGRESNERYALVAGFAEIGEAIEGTIRREVMEETGLHIKKLRYYKSQPWAYTDTLLFGFFCEVEGATDIVIDKNELSVAKWADREELPELDDGISLTAEMISLFKKKGRDVLV